MGTGGQASVAVAAGLDRAAAACARRGAQLTELRRQVLRLILEADQPVGAYALLDWLKAERPGAAPPTVYRALDFLLEQGLIHRVERLNAFVGCGEPGQAPGHAHPHDHPHQFLICRNCGATTELTDSAVVAAVEQAAARAGFTAARATVEIEGRCARCAGSTPAPG
jgi:Fur family zinc uptake transcriptional regulator